MIPFYDPDGGWRSVRVIQLVFVAAINTPLHMDGSEDLESRADLRRSVKVEGTESKFHAPSEILADRSAVQEGLDGHIAMENDC
jgi:hypothetical protein